MKILLVNPPSKPLARDMAGGLGFDSSKFNNLIPLDLVSLGTVLGKNHQVKIIDCLAEKVSQPKLLNSALAYNPDWIILNVSLPTWKNDALVAKDLKITLVKTKIALKFGLAFKELLYKVLKLSTANLCIFSENELLIENILLARKKAGTAKIVNKKLVVFPKETITDLNKLPIPNRSLLKSTNYHYHLLGKKEVTSIQTSRGCPMPCGFYCPYPLVQGKTWRSRVPEKVLQEIKIIITQQKIKHILFRDATFTLDKTRADKIARLIIKHKLKFSWWCETRINFLDYKLLVLLKQAGLLGMNIGVESGDEKLMKDEGKPGVNLKLLHQVKNWCDQLEIKLNFLLMIGLPSESKKTIANTYKLIKRENPYSIGLTILTPYPGTSYYNLAKKNGWIKNFDWSDYGGHQAVSRTKYLTAEDLEYAYKIINDLFYWQKNPSLKNKIKLYLKEKEFKQWLIT